MFLKRILKKSSVVPEDLAPGKAKVEFEKGQFFCVGDNIQWLSKLSPVAFKFLVADWEQPGSGRLTTHCRCL